MRSFVLCCGLLVATTDGAFAQAPKAKVDPSKEVMAEPKLDSPKAEDPRLIYMEVSALQTLDRLELTPLQLQTLLRLSKGAAATLPANAKTKTTQAFVKTLTELRDALVADDEDKIDDLKEKLEEVLDDDELQIDDRVPITGYARSQASAVIRLLKASQVHVYMDLIEPDELDPQLIVLDALDDGKDADAAKWKTIRDRAADDVAWLLVGSNELKSKALTKNLSDWIDNKRREIARGAEDDANLDIERQMKQATSQLDPFEIMRHAMEREMAELISNPRLAVAIDHRLNLAKKVAAAK